MQDKKVIVINPVIQGFNEDNPTEIPKKKVCAYARVSTDDEDQLNSYNAQIKEYTERINSNPMWTFAGLYADEGISGTSLKRRHSFNQMITDAKNGEIDLILTKSLSRFSRNTVDSLTIIRELREVNVEVYFEKENLYSSDTKIDFMLTIFSSIAQEEARNISENVKWGIRKRFKEGKVRINTKRFLGYDKDDDGNLVINEDEAKTIRMIFNLYVAGKSYGDICEYLIQEERKNGRGFVKWSPSSIKNILENEKYTGDVILQKTVVVDYLTHKSVVNDNIVPKYHIMNNHPAIVSKEQFKLVKLKKEARTNSNASKFKDIYPLSGLVICTKCGRPMNRIFHGYGKPSQRVVLNCKNNYHNSMPCDIDNIDSDMLEAASSDAINALNLLNDNIVTGVLDALKESFRNDDIIAAIEKEKEKIRITENEIVSLIEDKIKETDESMSKYYNDIYSTKRNYIEELELEIEMLESELLNDYRSKQKYTEVEEYLSDKSKLTAMVLSSFFKFIFVLDNNHVLMVMANDEVSKDEMIMNFSLLKESKPLYEASYTDNKLNETIHYKVVDYGGSDDAK